VVTDGVFMLLNSVDRSPKVFSFSTEHTFDSKQEAKIRKAEAIFEKMRGKTSTHRKEKEGRIAWIKLP
jgi:hypothetical protein